MISFVLPTRDRPRELRATLAAVAALPANVHDEVGGAEVIVVENASSTPVQLPSSLENGMPLRLLRRPDNEGAAARNVAAESARGDWLLMLDDDSAPLDAGHVQVAREAPSDVAAIGAEILLPDGSHEAGGLPEVFIGCGALIRREAFLDVGGYDPSFEFYVEEYDLCARLISHSCETTAGSQPGTPRSHSARRQFATSWSDTAGSRRKSRRSPASNRGGRSSWQRSRPSARLR
ncbi:MAG: glycosyltransferase family 2 protein [Planctomycetota bacterium]|jgi:GT2 family glycosyltransferase